MWRGVLNFYMIWYIPYGAARYMAYHTIYHVVWHIPPYTLAFRGMDIIFFRRQFPWLFQGPLPPGKCDIYQDLFPFIPKLYANLRTKFYEWKLVRDSGAILDMCPC